METTFIGDIPEGAVAVAFDLPDFDLSTVSLRLILLSLIQRHGVWVLITIVFCQFVRVETDALAEL